MHLSFTATQAKPQVAFHLSNLAYCCEYSSRTVKIGLRSPPPEPQRGGCALDALDRQRHPACRFTAVVSRDFHNCSERTEVLGGTAHNSK